MKRTFLAILAATLLLALPLSAGAFTAFPNITGLEIDGNGHIDDISGAHVSFLNMSGAVNNMVVTFTSFTGLVGPKATTKTFTFNAGKHSRGIETRSLANPAVENFIIPDDSGRFVEFQDVVVFGSLGADSSAALILRGLKEGGAVLLTPKGNKMFGPTGFELIYPLKNGTVTSIRGAAEVTINITNTGNLNRTPPVLPKGVMMVTNFQPADISTQTFNNGSTIAGTRVIIPADARISMSAGNKTFFLYTSHPVSVFP